MPEATTGSGKVEPPSDSDAEVGSNVSTIEPIQMSTTPQTPKGGQTMDPSSALSPGDIKPFPKAGPRKSRGGGRARGSCRVLTDTPEKKKIEEKVVGRINKKNQTVSNAGSEAESEHSSTSHETMENRIEEMEIQSGDIVLVMEDEKRGKKFSVSEKLLKSVRAPFQNCSFSRVAPFQKYVAKKASYQFEKWQVAKKMPNLEPTGQTERRA
ncbi:hypothetical protein QYM36_007578 [Artemia franciscana]|uniref:Uncharacterized protein n=1 Tax=Artemia franciscana TaxID=6661 RepID=A0AA88LCZ5_ARTSF|nr:hypothetical protein QYM36_007578 [Artemia franciscana]